MSAARHIDRDAQMLWISLRSEARAMTVPDLRRYWEPTFSQHEIDGAMKRLEAAGHVKSFGRVQSHYYVDDSCTPLPGWTCAAIREPMGVPAA